MRDTVIIFGMYFVLLVALTLPALVSAQVHGNKFIGALLMLLALPMSCVAFVVRHTVWRLFTWKVWDKMFDKLWAINAYLWEE